MERVYYTEALNHAGVEVVVYYDLDSKAIISLEEKDRNSIKTDRLLELPYAEHCKDAAWKLFYEMLDNDQIAIIENFPYRRGFFNYLREMDLYPFYEAAKAQAEKAMLQNFERQHSLSLGLMFD